MADVIVAHSGAMALVSALDLEFHHPQFELRISLFSLLLVLNLNLDLAYIFILQWNPSPRY